MPDEPSLELPSLFKRKRRPPAPVVADDSSPVVEDDSPPPPETRRPVLAPPLASLLTGAVVGLVAVGLVRLALRGCSGLRGTSSCGDSGILVLVAIFVVAVLGGRALLGLLRVPDAGSTAFLGTALVAVLTLLFVDRVDNATGAVVVTVVAAIAFGVAQWMTASFTEPGDRPR